MLHVCVPFLPELAPLFEGGVFYVIKISSKQGVAGWETYKGITTGKTVKIVDRMRWGFWHKPNLHLIAVLSFLFDILAEPEHFFT